MADSDLPNNSQIHSKKIRFIDKTCPYQVGSKEKDVSHLHLHWKWLPHENFIVYPGYSGYIVDYYIM